MLTEKKFPGSLLSNDSFTATKTETLVTIFDESYQERIKKIQLLSHQIFSDIVSIMQKKPNLEQVLISKTSLKTASAQRKTFLSLIQQLVIINFKVLYNQIPYKENELENYYLIPLDKYSEIFENLEKYYLNDPHFILKYYNLFSDQKIDIPQDSQNLGNNYHKSITSISQLSQIIFNDFFSLISKKTPLIGESPFLSLNESLTTEEFLITSLIHRLILAQVDLLNLKKLIPTSIINKSYYILENHLDMIKKNVNSIKKNCPQFFQIQEKLPLPTFSNPQNPNELLIIDNSYMLAAKKVQVTAFEYFHYFHELLLKKDLEKLNDKLITFETIKNQYTTEKIIFDLIHEIIVQQIEIMKVTPFPKEILQKHYLIPNTHQADLLNISKKIYLISPEFFTIHEQNLLVIDNKSWHFYFNLTPEEFVEAFDKTQERESLRFIAQKKIESYVKIAIPKKNTIISIELPKSRERIFKMFACDDPIIKEATLKSMVTLLENDPLESFGSDKLHELLTSYLTYLNPDEYNKMHASLKPIFVKVFAEILELLLFYNTCEKIILSEDTKRAAQDAADLLINNEIPESFFWSKYAKELAKHLVTDVSEFEEWIKRIAFVARASLQLASGIQNPGSDLAEALEKSYEDLKKAVDHIEPKKPWFQAVLTLKRLCRVSSENFSQFQQIVPSIQQMKHTSLTPTMYSAIISLEYLIFYSSKQQIQEIAMKLIIQYLNIQNKIIAHRIVKMLKKTLFFEINSKISYTSYLLMKLIYASDLIFHPENKKNLKIILDSYENSSYFINEEGVPFFESVIKYFLKGLSDRSFDSDIGGTTFLTILCPSSHKNLSAILKQLDELKSLRASEPDVNGNNAYHNAAMTDSKLIYALHLSEINLDINGKDYLNNDTPLHLAIRRNCSETAINILKCNANPNERNKEGNTPLHLAVANNCQLLIPVLMEYKADPNSVNQLGITPLSQAVSKNDPTLVDSIFKKTSEMDLLTDFNPLLQAIREEKYETLMVLLKYYKNIPLYAAIEILHMMVNPNKNLKCSLEFATFHATQLNNPEYAKNFKPYDNFPQPKWNNKIVKIEGMDESLPPLIQAAKNSDQTSILTDELSNSIDEIVNTPDRNNNTALSYIAMRSNLEQTIYKLVNHKANVDHFNDLGFTPLHLSVFKGNLKNAKALMECGANQNIETAQQKFNALHIAAFMFDKDMIELLLEKKVNPNAQSIYGDTPLNLLCLYAIKSPRVPNLKLISEMSPETIKRCPTKPLDLLEKLLSIKNFNPLIPDFFGNNLLHNSEDPEFIKVLCEKVPDLFWMENKEKQIPLELALLKKQNNKVKRLLTCMMNAIQSESKTESLKKLQKLLLTKTEGRLCLIHILAAANLDNYFEKIIKKNPSLSSHQDSSFSKSTPLHIAAKFGYEKILKIYESQNLEINLLDHRKNTPLHIAILKKKSIFAKSLIDLGADIYAKNSDGRAPIHFAAIKGNLQILQELCEKGASPVNPDANGNTPLHLAALKGHVHIVEYILKIDKVSVNSINEDGRTPVHFTCSEEVQILKESIFDFQNLQRDSLKILELFHKSGGDFQKGDASGVTPLMISSAYGYSEIVLFLIKNKVNLRSRDGNRMTALHYATREEQVEVVQLLLKYDNENLVRPNKLAITQASNANLELPIHILAKKKNEENPDKIIEIAKLLLEFGSPLTALDENKHNILHLACQNGHTELVEFFLKKATIIQKHDLFKSDNNGNTPLFFACRGNFIQIVNLLLNHEMNINFQNEEGQTPLMECAKLGLYELAEILIQKGVKTKKIDKLGQTALHHLLNKEKFGNKEELFLHLLLKNSPELSTMPDSIANGYNRPIHCLAYHGHKEALNILISYIPGDYNEKVKQIWKKNEDNSLPQFYDSEERGTAGAIALSRGHTLFANSWRSINPAMLKTFINFK